MISSNLLLLLMLLLLLQQIHQSDTYIVFDTTDLDRVRRIVGGHPSYVENQPYMVHIRRGGNFKCGGSLITPHCVLTAAHCFNDGQPWEFSVQGGASYLRDVSEIRYGNKIIEPREYNRKTMNSDIAILQLQQPLRGLDIDNVSISSRPPRIGSYVRVSGWGLTDDHEVQLPNQLHSVHVRVMSRSECQRSYRGYRNLSATMYCASVPGARDACDADSGGPAVNANNELVGIVSWGRGNRCARKDSPGVYTNVAILYDWIMDNMERYC